VLEPTIGLEPMTCRLRMQFAGYPPIPFNDLASRSHPSVPLKYRESHLN